MVLTSEQKYSELLKALGEVIAEKNLTICLHENTIQQLKEQHAAAEKERDFAKEKLADAAIAISLLQEEVKKLKGGAE